MTIIKRYRNRRLYDTDLKKTVTLDHIAHLLRTDTAFQVRDSGTGEDVTLSVISRIIIKELQTRNNHHIIPELGKALLKQGGENAMNILKKSLLAGIGIFSIGRERLHEIVDELVKQGEISDNERSEFLADLKDKVKTGSLDLKEKIERVVKETTLKVKQANAGEIKKLSKKLDAMARKLDSLQKDNRESGKDTKKTAVKKKPVKKKTVKKSPAAKTRKKTAGKTAPKKI